MCPAYGSGSLVQLVHEQHREFVGRAQVLRHVRKVGLAHTHTGENERFRDELGQGAARRRLVEKVDVDRHHVAPQQGSTYVADVNAVVLPVPRGPMNAKQLVPRLRNWFSESCFADTSSSL